MMEAMTGGDASPWMASMMPMGGGMGMFSVGLLSVAIAAADPMDVAVVDDVTRFYRSPDGGASWPAP